MDDTYWHKQQPDKPLFPDLEWSRPENKLHAGKLLIIGGNLHGFAAPAEAYQAAVKAGIGTTRVLLPLCLQKTIGTFLEAAEFAACTPSGGFNRQALSEFLELGHWANGVLFAGDLGRNSETAVLMESFLQQYNGYVTLTKDAVEYFYTTPEIVLQRSDTTVVVSLSQLQKLARVSASTRPVTFTMDLLQLVDFLHDFTLNYPVNIVVRHLHNIFVASGGEVSTTKQPEDQPIWRVQAAAAASVWWLQHPGSPFAALTTAVVT